MTCTINLTRGNARKKNAERRHGGQHAAECERTRRFLEHEIDFVPNKSFRADDVEDVTATIQPLLDAAEARAVNGDVRPRDNRARSAQMGAVDRLTAEQERELFRGMNYLKFKANALRVTLDPNHPDLPRLERAEQLLMLATAIRNHIIAANIRLVITVVKKFVTPQYTFDELLSDGIVTLMAAVDKFDYDRGFRFSTYAYQSIARGVYRVIADRQKASKRISANSDLLPDVPEESNESSLKLTTWQTLYAALARMIGRLDRREQFIIRGRFALGAHRKVQTFQALGDKLGVSKERARQMHQRALTKLQKMAGETQMQRLLPPETD